MIGDVIKDNIALNFKKLSVPTSIPFFQTSIYGVSTMISDQNEAEQLVAVSKNSIEGKRIQTIKAIIIFVGTTPDHKVKLHIKSKVTNCMKIKSKI